MPPYYRSWKSAGNPGGSGRTRVDTRAPAAYVSRVISVPAPLPPGPHPDFANPRGRPRGPDGRPQVGRRETVTRLLLLSLGLATAAGALFALLRPQAEPQPPLDRIDDASRARLEQVLRESDRPDRSR